MADHSPPQQAQDFSGPLGELEGVYERKQKAADFRAERAVLGALLPKLVDALRPLELVRSFALGSTATVWEVRDKHLDQRRALKLPRPRLAKLDSIIRVIRTEKETLARLTHQNIMKIYAWGDIDIRIDKVEYSFPFFLMDYLDAPSDLDVHVRSNLSLLNGETIISYFCDVARGLSFLHERKIYHCDIKPGNIVAALGAPVVITDLGYAKHFDRLPRRGKTGDLTEVICTPEYAHPTLLQTMVSSSDSAASKAEIPRADLKPAFDLFAFGRTIQSILRVVREEETGSGTVSRFAGKWTAADLCKLMRAAVPSMV